MNRIDRQRVSANLVYLEPARARANLDVRGDQHVRRVVIERGRAAGVELADGTVVRASDVVLAAGVIQDPLLLRRSGIDLPAVGRHLTDHFVVTLKAEVRPDAAPEGAPNLQTILRLTADGSDREHDLQITPFAIRRDGGRRELGMSISLQLPDGEGDVSASGPALDDPARIRWPFTALPANVVRLRDGWRTAVAIARASGLLAQPDALDAETMMDDDEIDRLVADSHTAFYHGVGTCRMAGETGEDGVVDADCRVFDVDGLRVCDASIIPTVPRSNTNLAVMAVAERLVERTRA
jgi:choline dehydrogenase-like flavoprotein